MNNFYDFHSWSTQYRQEKLAEAHMCRLLERVKESRERHKWGRLGFYCRNTLAPLLRNATRAAG